MAGLGGFIEADPRYLVFRYYRPDRSGVVDSRGVFIRDTPHYWLARAVLEGRIEPSRARGRNGVSNPDDCAFQQYQLHAAYENSYTMDVRDPIAFVHNVADWREPERFDVNEGTIQVVLDPSGRNWHYITDGAHRAAFVAAYNDVYGANYRIRCAIGTHNIWGNVTEVGSYPVTPHYDRTSMHDEFRRRLTSKQEPASCFYLFNHATKFWLDCHGDRDGSVYGRKGHDDDGPRAGNRHQQWHRVRSESGLFQFRNEATGQYLSCDGNGHVYGRKDHGDDWYMVPAKSGRKFGFFYFVHPSTGHHLDCKGIRGNQDGCVYGRKGHDSDGPGSDNGHQQWRLIIAKI